MHYRLFLIVCLIGLFSNGLCAQELPPLLDLDSFPLVKDWSIKKRKLHLVVPDFKASKKSMNAVRLCVNDTMSNMHLMDLLQQDSIYRYPLKINGKKYTGMLYGYLFEHRMLFAGRFDKGKRHGSFVVYEGSGGQTTYEFTHGKLDTIHSIEPLEPVVYKPIFYLYPEKKTKFRLKLLLENHQLLYTYPKYTELGWDVWAYPDGRLENMVDGMEYYGLYWEGQLTPTADMSKGAVVASENVEQFLEEKLTYMGFSRREINEFMIYWLPRLEKNDYNFIHFATKTWEKNAPIQISPQPDNVIRVFMWYHSCTKEKEATSQILPQFQRKGSVLVEWGGSYWNPTAQ